MKSFKDRIKFSLYFYSWCLIKPTWKALCLMKTTKLVFQQTSLYINPQLSPSWTGYFKIFLKKPFMRELGCFLFSSRSDPWWGQLSLTTELCLHVLFPAFQFCSDLAGWEHIRLEIKVAIIHVFLQSLKMLLSEIFTLEDLWAFPPSLGLYWYWLFTVQGLSTAPLSWQCSVASPLYLWSI